MKHLYLFYFVITFLSGVVSLGIGGFLYAKTKERLLWYCLLAYSAFTLFVVLEVMLWYIRINLPMIPLRAFHHATAFASRLSLFTSAVFVHYLFAVSHAKFKNIVFGTIVVIMSIPSYILLYVMHVNFVVAEYMGYTVSLVMHLYILLLSIVSFREVQQERRSLAKKVIFLLGISLLAMVAHILLEDLTELRFFPLIYCQYFGQFLSCFGNESSKFPKPQAYPGFGKSLRVFPKQPTIQALFKNCPNYC
jgi:hypothetical protein